MIEGSPGSDLPEPGLFFIIRTARKTAFSLLLHRQRNSLAKRKPDKTGSFLKEKARKSPRTLLKIYSKGKFMKIFLAKCDSRCGHPRCLSPVGIIQIFEGKNLT